MKEWFVELGNAQQVAIIVAGIGAVGGIIAAIVNGIFGYLSQKRGGKSSNYKVNQTGYDNASQIGIQFIKKEDE